MQRKAFILLFIFASTLLSYILFFSYHNTLPIEIRYSDVNVTVFDDSNFYIYVFNFTLEIWNPSILSKDIVLPFANLEFHPQINANLDNKTLEFHDTTLRLLGYATCIYQPGVTVKSIIHLFSTGKPGVSEFPTGFYRIIPSDRCFIVGSGADERYPTITYGLNMTVTENATNVTYDEIPNNWGSIQTSLIFVFIFLEIGTLTVAAVVFLIIKRIKA